MKQMANNMYVYMRYFFLLITPFSCNIWINRMEPEENKIIIVPLLPRPDDGDFPHYIRLVKDKDKEWNQLRRAARPSRTIELYGKTRMNRGNI